jgi:glycosyltransferase involved in cell wall biosynthesis
MLPAISVVVLCYRAGKNIRSYIQEVIQELERVLPSGWEIILVANFVEGSDDETPEIVREIARQDSRIKALTLVKKGMMGWDARSGLREAKGEAIALIDGDGQIESRDLIRVYKRLSEGFDLVKTYRIKRYDGLNRRLVSFIYSFMFNILFPGKVLHDINAKPKIIRREAYEKLNLKSNDWFLDAEIMLEARRLKFKIAELPSIFYSSRYRPSLVKKDAIFEFIKNMLKARQRYFL